MRKELLPSTCVSTLESWRTQIANWYAAGIQGHNDPGDSRAQSRLHRQHLGRVPLPASACRRRRQRCDAAAGVVKGQVADPDLVEGVQKIVHLNEASHR